MKFTIEVTTDEGRFTASCVELGITADAVYVDNALRGCVNDIMTALHKVGGAPQEAYERLVNKRTVRAASPVHYGCILPVWTRMPWQGPMSVPLAVHEKKR